MWKMFDWFTGSAKRAEREQLSPLPPVRRAGTTHAAHAAIADGASDSVSAAAPTLDSVLSTADTRQKAHQARLRSDLESRKDSMAYWRKNTRRERPTDSQAANYLSNSGQSWNPFNIDTAATGARARFDETTNHDLSDLSPLLSTTSRNYISDSYARKAQAEVDARALIKDSLPAPGVESYPHYQGGWEPEKLEDGQPIEQEMVALEQSQTEQELLQPQFLSDTEAQQSTTLDRMPATQIIDVRLAAADHPQTSREMLMELAHDANPDVRFAIAENHNADREILLLLAGDENPFVASRAKKTLKRLDGGQLHQGNFSRNTGSERVHRLAH